jgi:hypothetical protein
LHIFSSAKVGFSEMKKETPMDFSIPLDGIKAESTAFDAAAGGIAHSFLPGSNSSAGTSHSTVADSLDLSASAVALLQAKVGFEANARLTTVEGEME